ncbi:Vgb family protein [Streptomyces sp. NPDC002671]
MAPDGTVWVAETSLGFLASISTSGRITQHRLADALHAPSLDPSYLAIASDGSVWFTCPLNVGRVAPDGRVSLFDRPPVVYGIPDVIITGTNGSIWYGSTSFRGSQLIHITSSLSATRVSVPSVQNPLGITGLTQGPGGRLWFTESSNSNDPDEVGYADSSGHTKVWPLPTDVTPVGAIVPGPDGALWFAETNGIGRITPNGAISSYRTPKVKNVLTVIAGPDHALWFTTPTDLGRITTAGVITLWPVPGAKKLTDLIYDSRHHGFLITDPEAAVLRWLPKP